MATFIVLVIVVAIIAGIGLAIAASLLGSSGKLAVVASMTPDEVANAIESAFVPGGWALTYRGENFMTLQTGPSGCTGLFLLVLFLPLGLVYLLTDWGRGKLTVRYPQRKSGQTEVYFEWSNASIGKNVRDFAEWLTER